MLAARRSVPATPIAASLVPGYPADPPGGSGWNQVTMTSWADSGPGTFRTLANTSPNQPLIIDPPADSGGVIDMLSNINVRRNNLIFRGERAGGPVNFRGPWTFYLSGHTIRLRHCHREVLGGPGQPYNNRDGFEIGTGVQSPDNNVEDVWLTNITLSGQTDEGISVFGNPTYPHRLLRRIYVALCTFGEPVCSPTIRPGEGDHKMPILFGAPPPPALPASDCWAWLNHYHSARERGPRIAPGVEAGGLDSVWTNFGRRPVDLGHDLEIERPTKALIRGNIWKRALEAPLGPLHQGVQPGMELWMPENTNFMNGLPFNITAADIAQAGGVDPRVADPPIAIPGFVQLTPLDQIEQAVLVNAGATPWFANAKADRFTREAVRGEGEFREEWPVD